MEAHYEINMYGVFSTSFNALQRIISMFGRNIDTTAPSGEGLHSFVCRQTTVNGQNEFSQLNKSMNMGYRLCWISQTMAAHWLDA